MSLWSWVCLCGLVVWGLSGTLVSVMGGLHVVSVTGGFLFFVLVFVAGSVSMVLGLCGLLVGVSLVLWCFRRRGCLFCHGCVSPVNSMTESSLSRVVRE